MRLSLPLQDTRAAAEVFPERFPVAALLPGGEGPGPLLAHLREHGWAVLRDTEAGAALAADVSAACSAFFGEDDDAKKRHAQSCPGKIGKLHMWGAGYSRQRVREQFHIVVGAEEHCSWGERHELRELVSQQTRHLAQVCRLCVAAVGREALQQCEELEAEHGDPSVMDIFRYFNVLQEGRPEGNMGSHFDPGLFTLKPVSRVPGLDVLDAANGRWINVEAAATPGQDLLMFSGETLEALTEGEFKATSHRVHTEGQERLSIVYEMRSHHVA